MKSVINTECSLINIFNRFSRKITEQINEKRYIFIVVILLLANAQSPLEPLSDEALAQRDRIWFTENPHSLPIWETLEERQIRVKGLYQPDPHYTAPPPPPIRNIAEYERMEGILIRHPLGISVNLVKEMSQDAIVYCITNNSSSASSQFENGGVNMDNVTFINALTDSYWTRDYGPWWIADGNDDIGIVDFNYNRPRPRDDRIPSVLDDEFGVPYYKMSIETAGGNYMCDGYNNASSTKLVIKENSNNESKVRDNHEEYLGITNLHLVDDPNLGSAIDHIDCWGKFLTPSKIMIRRVKQGNNDFNALEKAAEYWAQQTSPHGKSYTVYRVLGTGRNEAYTNCTILNHKVLVPLSNTGNDDAAIEAYKKALPGYEVLGFTGSWQSIDALHCRTKGIPDREMLSLQHLPLIDTVVSTNGEGYKIIANIVAYSKENLIDDSLLVYYKPEHENTYSTVPLKSTADNTFEGIIPQQNNSGEMAYYIHASDESGRSESHPLIGKSGAHIFYAKSEGTFTGYPKNLNNVSLAVNNYPNPFTTYTNILYHLKQLKSNAKITVYTHNGQIVREWNLKKSISSITWDGTDENNQKLAAGAYVYIIINGKEKATKILSLMH